jgi:hypothetical protein
VPLVIALSEALRTLAAHLVNLALDACVGNITILEDLTTDTGLGGLGQLFDLFLGLRTVIIRWRLVFSTMVLMV